MSSSVNPLSSLGSSLGTSGTGTTSGGGLGQGINVQQFVQFAVAGQQASITALENQQTGLNSQASELSTISSDLSALKNAAAALNDPLGALNAEVATSSNSNVLTANAAGTAVAGAHTISISNLATTSSYYTDAAATSSTALATGDTINISVGGNSVASVTIDSTNNTLDKLAAAINNSTSAVQASVINDANGARLAIVSATSGAPGNIGVTGSLHLTNPGNTAINFHQAVAGLNAQLQVDGVPISSTTNTVTGVINGVTLNLAAPTVNNGVDNPVSLTVAADTSQATTAVSNFVSAYNTVVTEINNQFNVASDGSGGGPLEADNSLRQVQSLLLGAISYSVPGNNGIVNLASLGVDLNSDGTLAVNNSTLSSALSSNFAAVQNLLQSSTNGFSQNISTINGPGSGILSLDTQSITSTAQDITHQISGLQAALAVQEQNLTAVYSRVNATLQELPLLENQLTQQLAGIA
jgi:flagellar hook-associated protein 2